MQDEDRQTQEAFEDYFAVSSIPEESIDRTPLSAEQRRDLLRDSAKFVAEMTPIVGDAMSAREVWEELQKEEPNYLLVGALAGATAVGLIPGIGDAAAQAIRTGARRGLDFARRVEVDPNALGSTGGNIRLRPEGQPTPETSLNITPPAPLNSLEELLDYNNQVRQPRGMIDRDLVLPNDNILYRPDRGYRAIGPEGYQDFLESGIVRAVADNKKKLYETPYFMRGQSSSAYVKRRGEDYIVEAPLDTSWRGAGYSGDKYVGPSGNQAITRDSPIRVFRRNDDGTFEVVFDNIGDTALLPSQFNRGGLVDEDRQTQEAFDATTGQAMALTPPRVEDQEYPEFRDLLVVEDTTIREGLGGYYNDKLNLLAVSPRIARDPNLFKGVLLHEVQHAIQKIEGFDRGTSTLSPEVSEIARPRLQEAQRKYDEALQNFESFDFEPALDDVKIFISELLDDIEADGLVAPEDITFSTPHRTGWEQNLNILADRLSEDRVSPLDSYETLLDFYALVRDNPNLVPDKDVFKDSFGVTPDDLVDSDVGSFLNSLESAEVIPVDPHRLKFLETDILRDVYRSKEE
jgi:hypothetical protein